jgi:hypothetical protein
VVNTKRPSTPCDRLKSCLGRLTIGLRMTRQTAPLTHGVRFSVEYETVFDVTQGGFRQWSFSAFGLIFIVVGLAAPTLIRLGVIRRPSPWMEKWFPRLFLGFALIWTLTSFISTYSDYRGAIDAMHTNRAKVVEGIVTKLIYGLYRPRDGVFCRARRQIPVFGLRHNGRFQQH